METIQKKSIPESGHAKNVANLEDLIVRCISYGAVYNPGRQDLQIASLQHLFQEAQLTLNRVADAATLAKTASNERRVLFDKMRKLATQVIHALIACGATPKTIADARGIHRRITGKRAGKKATPNDATTTEASVEVNSEMSANNGTVSTAKTISTSQQSFDLLVQHFSRLVSLLQNEPMYVVNESELQVSTLSQLLQQLREANTKVTHAETEVETARIQRTNVLYDETTGLVVRAKQVKSYVKALFGVNSPQYKQISKLSFRKFK
jgi:hypothetical protein